MQGSPHCLSQMTTSSSLMSVPDVYLKLVPALRPYFHQITGVVWAVSWRWDVRKRIFHDFLSLIQAVGTENVSFQKPVSFGLWLVVRSDCLGNLLRAVQPPAQFLASVPEDNSDLIFTTVVVRHVFSPSSATQRCAVFIFESSKQQYSCRIVITKNVHSCTLADRISFFTLSSRFDPQNVAHKIAGDCSPSAIPQEIR